MKTQRSRIYFLLIVVVVGFLLVFLIVNNRSLSAQINIEVVPSGSSVKLNNKGIREGVSKIKPGKYEVVFSHQGFSTISERVELSKGEKRYIGAALRPTVPTTADWYQKHPDDAKKSEGISSKNFDQSTYLKAKSLPLLKELPYIDRYFRVDYGPGVKSKDPATSTAIYIRASSPENRQMALNWIKQQGFDPTDYEIIFKSFDNPFASGD